MRSELRAGHGWFCLRCGFDEIGGGWWQVITPLTLEVEGNEKPCFVGDSRHPRDGSDRLTDVFPSLVRIHGRVWERASLMKAAFAWV
jgi:hypothetical protein